MIWLRFVIHNSLLGLDKSSLDVYRVAQNLGKQVLRTHYLKFHSLSSDFAVFTHGERDLHNLRMAESAVHI